MADVLALSGMNGGKRARRERDWLFLEAPFNSKATFYMIATNGRPGVIFVTSFAQKVTADLSVGG